jgi:hypothetical protein
MAYGIAMGVSGTVYEMSEDQAKRIAPQSELDAKKRSIEREKIYKKHVRRRNRLAKEKQKHAIAVKKAAPIIAAKKKKDKKSFAALRQNNQSLGREDHYRALPGMIGDGLSGFGERGENLISDFGADFGSLAKDSGRANFGQSKILSEKPLNRTKPALKPVKKVAAKREINWNARQGKTFNKKYMHDDFAGLGTAKDASSLNLVFHINEAIKAKHNFDLLEKEAWAKVKKLPASPAKTAMIAKLTADGQNYQRNELTKLYKAIDLIELALGQGNAFVNKLRFEVNRPATAAAPVTVTMGIAPLVMGVVAGGAAVGAIAALASYLTGNRAATAQMLANSAQIDKLMAIAADTKASPEAKAAAYHSIASLTEANKQLSTDTGIFTNLTKLAGNLPMLIGVGLAGFLFVKFGLPMMNAHKKLAHKQVEVA